MMRNHCSSTNKIKGGGGGGGIGIERGAIFSSCWNFRRGSLRCYVHLEDIILRVRSSSQFCVNVDRLKPKPMLPMCPKSFLPRYARLCGRRTWKVHSMPCSATVTISGAIETAAATLHYGIGKANNRNDKIERWTRTPHFPPSDIALSPSPVRSVDSAAIESVCGVGHFFYSRHSMMFQFACFSFPSSHPAVGVIYEKQIFVS